MLKIFVFVCCRHLNFQDTFGFIKVLILSCQIHKSLCLCYILLLMCFKRPSYLGVQKIIYISFLKALWLFYLLYSDIWIWFLFWCMAKVGNNFFFFGHLMSQLSQHSGNATCNIYPILKSLWSVLQICLFQWQLSHCHLYFSLW